MDSTSGDARAYISCFVFPLSSARAWGSRSITASSDSAAPRGLPGRFRINDFSPHSADRPAERGHRGLLRAFEAHAFGDAFQQAVADRAGGFGGDVALGDSGPAGGHDQASLAGQADDRLLDRGLIVGNDFSRDYQEIPAS